MRVFRGLEDVRPGDCPDPVCAVGVFDGVHRGHRQLLYELCVWAKSVAGTPFVITFERHPLEALKGIPVPEILTIENRLIELERHGVEAVLLLDFAAVKDLPAEAFLREVMLERIGGRRLLLGFDSHIGKGRDGTPATLPDIVIVISDEDDCSVADNNMFDTTRIEFAPALPSPIRPPSR